MLIEESTGKPTPLKAGDMMIVRVDDRTICFRRPEAGNRLVFSSDGDDKLYLGSLLELIPHSSSPDMVIKDLAYLLSELYGIHVDDHPENYSGQSWRVTFKK